MKVKLTLVGYMIDPLPVIYARQFTDIQSEQSE